MRGLAVLLALPLALHGQPHSPQNMSQQAAQAWANVVGSWTPTPTYTPTNTPTITPTFTPLPVPVTSGTTRRIFSVGNSHWSAGNCADGSERDGVRPGFLAAYKDATGGLGYFVGEYLNTYPTPLVEGSYTNAVGGTYSYNAYDQIRDNLPAQIGAPTANDRLVIMSAANDAKLDWTTAMEKASQYAQVTKAVAVMGGLGKIWLCNDLPIKPNDTAAVRQGVLDAYNQLVADGVTNVYFLDTNSMLDWNPPTYLPDYCADPDPGHQTLSGMRKLGAAMVQSLVIQGGL